ncbi:nitroreductase family protein [Anaerovibrio sp.]|uniref:nitroreductase family protein n=1 Tax=Anaerovibrio sp. TaxID=1872532 RepID=UPI003F16A9B8
MLTEIEAISLRHAVRKFTDRPIEPSIITELEKEIEACNQESGLHIQLITNDTGAFKSLLPFFSRFKNADNYIALIGRKQDDCYEACGYYGARLMIKAQRLGLNSCWTASSFNKDGCHVQKEADENILSVIAIGYGITAGKPHKSKPADKLTNAPDTACTWFRNGLQAALLAPTGYNKQNFFITQQNDDTASIEATDSSPLSKIGLGIVKYHFEAGAGRENFHWQ